MKLARFVRGLPMFRRVSAGGSLLVAMLCGASTREAPAQIPPLAPALTPAGFAATPAFAQTQQANQLRAVLGHGRNLLFAITGRLYRTRQYQPTNRLLIAQVNGDIAWLAHDPAGDVLVGTLDGNIRIFDGQTLQEQARRPGVANTFDVEVLANGSLLASANPQWASNGNSGIWLLRPNGATRELLSLVGPSAPLLLLANGDLVIGELGLVVPPPAGTARLLRIPANTLQAAMAGQTLTMADVTEVGSGYDGIYDLVELSDGRVLSTNPNNGEITVSVAGGLDAAGPWLDFGTNRFATRMQLRRDAPTPFAAYQPPAHAPELLVTTTDYFNWFEIERVQSVRPTADVAPAGPQPPGTVTLTLRDAPPAGIALWLASLTAAVEETAPITLAGMPIWLGLPAGDTVIVGQSSIDNTGQSSWSFNNPGIDHRIDWQTFTWSPSGISTSNTFATYLQP